MYAGFSGIDFEKLKSAIKEGSEPEYQRYFGRCLGKYWDTRADGARLLRALILQQLADSAGNTLQERDAAINIHFRRLLLPYLLYREVISGNDAVSLLEENIEAIETVYIPSDYDSVFMLGAAALFYGRRDLLARLANLQSIRRGTGYYDVETYSNYFKALLQLIDCNYDSLTLDRLVDGLKFPSRTRALKQYEKFHLTHLRILAFEVAALAFRGHKAPPRNIVDFTRYSAGALIEQLTGLSTDSSDESLRLICQVHQFAAEIEEFDPFIDTSKAYDTRCDGSPFAYMNHLLYAATGPADEFLKKIPGNALAVAQNAQRSGMYFLAANMAGMLHRDRDIVAETEEILRIAKSRNICSLIILKPLEEKWETVLKDLSHIEKSRDDTAAGDPDTGKKVFDWEIELEENLEPYQPVYYVAAVKARVRSYTKTGALTKGRSVSLETILSDISAFEISAEDFKPLLIAQKILTGSRYSYGGPNYSKLILNLCAHPRVVVTDPLAPNTYTRCTLFEYEVGITTSSNSGGDLEISLPTELKSALASSYGEEDEPILKKFGDGNYGIPVFSKETKQAARIIKTYVGDRREIRIPAVSTDTARPLLEKAASAVLFQGDYSSKATASDFNRKNVDPRIHVRIDLPANADPEVSIAVHIPTGGGTCALPPGSGESELIFRPGGRPVIFTRDLESESANAKPVLDIIHGVEDKEPISNSSWRLGGIEPLLDMLERLKTLNETVDIDWCDKTECPSVAKVSSVTLSASSKGASHWFGISGDISFDNGNVMTFEKIIESLPKTVGKYIRLDDGHFVQITEQLRNQIEFLNSLGEFKNGELQVNDAMLPAINNSLGDVPDGEERPDDSPAIVLPEILKKKIGNIRAELGRDIKIPGGLNAELRPYQQEGYKWLSHLAGCGIGACLADDMGLGKTVQIIALLLDRASNGASLVVAPTSVGPNWISEIRKFAPELRPLLIDPANDVEAVVSASGAYDVVVSSYGMCQSRKSTFAKKTWECLVLDEAQAIKNHTAKRTRAVKDIRSAVRIAATGTPVENRLTEFWSIFDFLNPGMLMSAEKFASRYTEGGMATPQLKKIVSPLVLRRLKTEVLKDLPEKTEVNLMVKLTKNESEAYEACRRLALEKMQNGLKVDSRGNKFEILAELTRLRRFCCHPSLLIPELKESAKLDALKELLSDLKDSGHKALVFSQFTDYLAIVRNMVEENGWKYFYLDGATPQKQRSELVSRFQNEEADFFLISLKAGGFGLNLTAANYVILLDPWWNPAVENQAADRIHRIGQELPVTVYRLIAENTIEERVVALHGEKLKIAEDLLGGTGSASLSEGDLINLLK